MSLVLSCGVCYCKHNITVVKLSYLIWSGIEANNVDAALIKGDRALTSVLVLSLQET